MNHTKRCQTEHCLGSVPFDLSFACDRDDKGELIEGSYVAGRTVGKIFDAAGRHIDRVLKRTPGEAPSQSTNNIDMKLGQRGHDRLPSTSIEVSFVCDGDDTFKIAGEQYISGKTVFEFLDITGHVIDKSLSKMAKQIGYGPTLTAERIRQRLALIKHSFEHYEKPCPPEDCSSCYDGGNFLPSPEMIREETQRFLQDVNRLMSYLDSNVQLTQKQAVGCILDLSIEFRTVRGTLKQLGAVEAINNILRSCSNVRRGDGYYDNLLLSSSRKALVSLRDADINTLLHEWNTLKLPNQTLTELWHKIAHFLHDKDVVFLIIRVLNRTGLHVAKEVIKSVAPLLATAPSYLEWQEFETFCCLILSNYSNLRWCQREIQVCVMRSIARLRCKMPKLLETRAYKDLSIPLEDLGSGDLLRTHTLKAAMIQAISEDQRLFTCMMSSGESERLWKICDALSCPFERAICDFIWDKMGELDSLVESVYAPPFCNIIARYINSDNIDLRDKAWHYANYFFNYRDHVYDKLMLEAVCKTDLGATDEFARIERTLLAQHVPKEHEYWGWKTIYRHVNDKNDRLCLVGPFVFGEKETTSCACSFTAAEELRYTWDWFSFARVEGLNTVSTADTYPLFAGCGQNGVLTYVSRIGSQEIRCKYCIEKDHDWEGKPEWERSIMFAVAEGTKPEDLRIEVRCAHRNQLLIPDYIDLFVLRYPTDKLPEELGSKSEGVDATGPFSWKRAERREPQLRPYTARAMSVDEALESGWSLEDIGMRPENHRSTVYEWPTNTSCMSICNNGIDNDTSLVRPVELVQKDQTGPSSVGGRDHQGQINSQLEINTAGMSLGVGEDEAWSNFEVEILEEETIDLGLYFGDYDRTDKVRIGSGKPETATPTKVRMYTSENANITTDHEDSTKSFSHAKYWCCAIIILLSAISVSLLRKVYNGIGLQMQG